MNKLSMIVITGLILVYSSTCWAGLVGYWSFDDSANPGRDDSGNGNDGTVYGAKWTTLGKVNGALDFDGVNDYISYGDILDNEIENAFTIEVWVKLSEGALQKSHNYIFWKGDDRPGIRVNSDGTVSFAHWYRGAECGFRSTHVLKEAEWYYLSYVFDGSEFIGYINAEYIGSISDSGYSPGGTLRIARDEKTYRYFNGVIDEVRIYDYAIPEPASAVMLGLGSLFLALRRRRRQA